MQRFRCSCGPCRVSSPRSVGCHAPWSQRPHCSIPDSWGWTSRRRGSQGCGHHGAHAPRPRRHRSARPPRAGRGGVRTGRSPGCCSRAVPFDGSCLLTFDPATLLPTGEVVENGLPADSDGPADRDRTARAGLQQVRRARPRATLGGEPERCHRGRPRPEPSPARAPAAEWLRRRAAGRVYGRHRYVGRAHPVPRREATAILIDRDVRFVASLAEPLADGLRARHALRRPAATA